MGVYEKYDIINSIESEFSVGINEIERCMTMQWDDGHNVNRLFIHPLDLFKIIKKYFKFFRFWKKPFVVLIETAFGSIRPILNMDVRRGCFIVADGKLW